MTIITKPLKECEICRFYEEKADGLCSYCYRRIMKKWKNTNGLTDDQILKINELRKKFYLEKYGDLLFFPQDKITDEVRRILFLKKLEKKWEKVVEIRY